MNTYNFLCQWSSLMIQMLTVKIPKASSVFITTQVTQMEEG